MQLKGNLIMVIEGGIRDPTVSMVNSKENNNDRTGNKWCVMNEGEFMIC